MVAIASQEMKGNYLKRCSHVMFNFRNVPYTIAWRLQFYANHSIITGEFKKDYVSFEDGKVARLNTLCCAYQLADVLSLNLEECVLTADRLKFRGQKYCQGNVLVVNASELLPKFGILCFAVQNRKNGMVLLVLNLLETVKFSEHFWSFVVLKTSEFCVVTLQSLADYHPLDLYDAIYPGDYFVNPR